MALRMKGNSQPIYREGREKQPDAYSGANRLEAPSRKERLFIFTSMEKVLEHGM